MGLKLSSIRDAPVPDHRITKDVERNTLLLHPATAPWRNYEIDLDRVRTMGDVLCWILHLSEKTWADSFLLRDVAACLAKHLTTQGRINQ